MEQHQLNRESLSEFSRHTYDFDLTALRQSASALFATDAMIHLAHPMGSAAGFEHLAKQFEQLLQAMPDLERRETIKMAGPSQVNGDWVGICGYYTGVMVAPWLDIPPTGHQVAMRFHEFFKLEDGKVVEVQALWDIPELMMQCNAWPMAPGLGRHWQVPGPATQDGMLQGPRTEQGDASYKIVDDMLNGLAKFAEEGAESMGLATYWHPKMNWYGPAGIGTNRGIQGFRHWHQIPFLKAMPDRGGTGEPLILFGDGDYVGVTGWPNMRMTLSGDGWMGIAPGNQALTMRSLDFWRCENGMIRENWVLVDILDVYHQLGVDVFERMRELNPTPVNRGTLPG